MSANKNLVDEAIEFDKSKFDDDKAGRLLREFYETMVKDKDPEVLENLKLQPFAAVEFKDIIELELFRRLNSKMNNVKTREIYEANRKKEQEYIEGLVDHPVIPKRNVKGYIEEQKILSQMTPELLENSEREFDEVGVTVKTHVSQKEQSELIKRGESIYGHYGIPMRAKKVLIVAGDKVIKANNEAIQEAFRAPYYNKLIKMSGIDIDVNSLPEFRKEQSIGRETGSVFNQNQAIPDLDLDEYEVY